jgi:hypothetical protein
MPQQHKDTTAPRQNTVAHLGPAQQAEEANRMSDELTTLQGEFPDFRIWRETIADRVRYVARSRHANLNPHTVVTDDLAELRAALKSSPDTTRTPAGPASGTVNVANPIPEIAERVHGG